ncbi:hypothetical protein Bca4012_067511 [Brassica carinata]
MHRSSSRQPYKANKETISTAKTRQENARVTRSRAKALGTSTSPSNPVFEQEPKLKKRMASDDIKVCQHKKRAVLKDVTNTLDGSNVKASMRGRDVDVEKSKLAEDLSKIRMVESATNSKDGDQKEDGYDVTGYLKSVDIDSSAQDPRFCSLYAADMYDSFHVAELDQRPSTSYMVQVQRDIGPSMRGILIDWLVEVSEEYKLASDTLYLAVNIIDRFLTSNYIEKRRLQLLGVTCMLIASRFIQAAHASDQDFHTETEFLANYLAELTLVEYSFLRFLPSLIAASAVFLARWTLDQSKHPWNSTLQHYTRYETPSLQNTVLAIEDLQLNTSGSTLVAIRNKYNQEKMKPGVEFSSDVTKRGITKSAHLTGFQHLHQDSQICGLISDLSDPGVRIRLLFVSGLNKEYWFEATALASTGLLVLICPPLMLVSFLLVFIFGGGFVRVSWSLSVDIAVPEGSSVPDIGDVFLLDSEA